MTSQGSNIDSHSSILFEFFLFDIDFSIKEKYNLFQKSKHKDDV
jgi:hypothetical protein